MAAEERILNFFVNYFEQKMSDLQIAESEVQYLDIFASGLVDSLGFITFISALEKEYGIQIDFDRHDILEMTIVGNLLDAVAEELDQ